MLLLNGIHDVPTGVEIGGGKIREGGVWGFVRCGEVVVNSLLLSR